MFSFRGNGIIPRLLRLLEAVLPSRLFYSGVDKDLGRRSGGNLSFSLSLSLSGSRVDEKAADYCD